MPGEVWGENRKGCGNGAGEDGPVARGSGRGRDDAVRDTWGDGG